MTFHKQMRKWQVIVAKDRKYYYLGLFETKSEAQAAYNEKARELHGEFAREGE